MFYETLSSKRHIEIIDRRTRQDWAHVMREISDTLYPAVEKIVVELDNLNAHTPASFYVAFESDEARRLTYCFEFHYTPKHGSWLNMAEIEFSVFSRQCLKRRIPDEAILSKEVHAWVDQRNANVVKVQW